MTRLTSNEIFSPSNKINQEVRRAKDLSAPLYYRFVSVSYECSFYIMSLITPSTISLVCM